MKSTNERLLSSYCVPITEYEWAMIAPNANWRAEYCIYEDGQVRPTIHAIYGKTPVSVEVFSDLIHDRIAPWRLLEDGFVNKGRSRVYTHNTIDVICKPDLIEVWIEDSQFHGIKTYTKLLNLIEMKG